MFLQFAYNSLQSPAPLLTWVYYDLQSEFSFLSNLNSDPTLTTSYLIYKNAPFLSAPPLLSHLFTAAESDVWQNIDHSLDHQMQQLIAGAHSMPEKKVHADLLVPESDDAVGLKS